VPLWIILAGGAGLLYWFWQSQHAACPTPMGAPTGQRYAINAPAQFFNVDPTSVATSAVGTLAEGSYVYATAQTPITSADASYELVLSPCNGAVWIMVSNLTPS